MIGLTNSSNRKVYVSLTHLYLIWDKANSIPAGHPRDVWKSKKSLECAEDVRVLYRRDL